MDSRLFYFDVLWAEAFLRVFWRVFDFFILTFNLFRFFIFYAHSFSVNDSAPLLTAFTLMHDHLICNFLDLLEISTVSTVSLFVGPRSSCRANWLWQICSTANWQSLGCFTWNWMQQSMHHVNTDDIRHKRQSRSCGYWNRLVS